MQSIGHDVREGLRLPEARPLFSALVVVTFALAIGANATIFNVVNAVLLRALPYQDPSRLVLLYQGTASSASPIRFLGAGFRGVPGRDAKLHECRGVPLNRVQLSGLGQPERVPAARISAPLFDVLGVPLALGRPFTDKEDAGRQPVVILSDAIVAAQVRIRSIGRVDVRSASIGRRSPSSASRPGASRFPLAGRCSTIFLQTCMFRSVFRIRS